VYRRTARAVRREAQERSSWRDGRDFEWNENARRFGDLNAGRGFRDGPFGVFSHDDLAAIGAPDFDGAGSRLRRVLRAAARRTELPGHATEELCTREPCARCNEARDQNGRQNSKPRAGHRSELNSPGVRRNGRPEKPRASRQTLTEASD
jgi:hypothetical protein